MAKKPLNPLEDPPTASSSEDDELETSADEEDEEDEEVSSSEEEDESKDPINKKTSDSVTITLPGKSTTAGDKAASDSDSGSETETDSDSESERPPNSGSGKSIAAVKKKEDPPSSSAALALPAVKKSATTKRPASSEGGATTSTKRAKTGGGEEESIKKPAFQRLWSEEDEIAVLQGMIDFKSDTGKSPYEDTNGFYDFIKKSISFEVSKNQFMDKIRSLKKKFIGKEVKNGVEPSFLKAHDRKSYGLSKVIWGPDGIAVESSNGVAKKSQSQSKSKSKSKKLDSVKQELVFGGVSSSANGKKVEEDEDDDGDKMLKSDWFDKSFLVRAIAGFGVGEFTVKEKWSLVSVENKKMVEEKLKLLQDKEFEFVLEKTEFLHEVTSMIAEASKKNKSI